MSITRPFTGTSRTISKENSRIGEKNFMDKLVGRKSCSDITTLEEIVDIDKDLEVYNNQEINLLNPRILYHVGRFKSGSSLLKINREEQILVTERAVNLQLVSKQTTREIKKKGRKLAHLGLIIIGIKGLTRKKLGTKVLLTILDKRWTEEAKKALIAAMEIDLSDNVRIFYCSPNFILSINDLQKIEIGIQTRGYEEFLGHSNLLINIGYLGRLTGSSTIQYKLDIKQIVEAMSSKGIKMLKPIEISPELLGGLDWNINKNLEEVRGLIPEENIMFKNEDNSYNIRYSGYKIKPIEDEEELEYVISSQYE